MKFLAKTFASMEEILAQEIDQLGGQNIRLIKRGVEFEGDKRLLYRANLELRTALRILVPIASFKAQHETHFYNKVKEIDWTKYMTINQTFAIDSVVRSKIFTHSQYIGLKAKDAVADLFREKFFKRPNVNTLTPDLLINVHIHEDDVTISLDSSGESLHKRGYRVDTLDAPINEVLAAGMIALSGWTPDLPFMDAMCGSGTLLVEAAQKAYNIPPQYGRDYFCFKRWLDFDKALFEDIIKNQQTQINDNKPIIKGSDLSFQAIRVSERNIEAAGLKGKIPLERKDFFKLTHEITPETDPEKPNKKGVVIMNPPYDERMKMEDAQAYYKQIGDTMKKNWKGWDVWLISSNIEALKSIGLKTSRRFSLLNGALECKFMKYEMY
jgi:putative N6-adenine-specific DNA methylase